MLVFHDSENFIFETLLAFFKFVKIREFCDFLKFLTFTFSLYDRSDIVCYALVQDGSVWTSAVASLSRAEHLSDSSCWYVSVVSFITRPHRTHRAPTCGPLQARI